MVREEIKALIADYSFSFIGEEEVDSMEKVQFQWPFI